jgi:hypothetical protein
MSNAIDARGQATLIAFNPFATFLIANFVLLSPKASLRTVDASPNLSAIPL